MDAPTRQLHLSARVEVSANTRFGGNVHHAGYDDRPRPDQECVSDPRCQRARQAVLRKQLRRAQVAAFFANLPACLVGMEACSSAHHWVRKLQVLGHTVRLMAPQFVKPYVKSNKNDVADAEAICEAVTRPSMRFVPVKNIEQQARLSLHRVRQGAHGWLL
ncbi:transposase TnpA (plasmid) [Cupriavidus necator N-1]|uniref:Transposase TnpA n=1 Tax=Cupriavidus necator (strain ATCC 43291 / DSM 13513 / CCUG 52238 / LMG 8453 / N-1) TaxID=1042878 RepID=F8GYL1_CUPNN|nr:transposase TnpA [Cupriavidus necator N-1]